MASSEEYSVLVTGGGGCLGQHLIGLLQTRAPHVTEIRVLDIKPYENRLGTEHAGVQTTFIMMKS